MDELLEGLKNSSPFTFDLNDTNKPHPRFSDLFKFKRDGYGDQESRRRKVMEEQKSRRRDYVDYARRVIEGEIFSDDDSMEEEGFDEVDGASKKTGTKRYRSKNPYRNQLMLSEWLVDIPVDFEEKWYMVICPVAKRCLILSYNGKTYAYSRTGHFFKQFSSGLPGGNAANRGKYCILDCLFHEGQQTFFVLDIMCWGGHPVYDSDTEFRFYWLNSKLTDYSHELLTQSRANPYKFVALQSHSCSSASIHEILRHPQPFQVDGLVFFHKEAHYFRGRSPVVLWLKPHMIKDILGIPVSDEFMACVPLASNDVSMDDITTSGTGSAHGKVRNDKSKNTVKAMDTGETVQQPLEQSEDMMN